MKLIQFTFKLMLSLAIFIALPYKTANAIPNPFVDVYKVTAYVKQNFTTVFTHYTTPNEYHINDSYKMSTASKYIGNGFVGSHTDVYRLLYGSYANTHEYKATDIVFVSTNGNRSDGNGILVVDVDGNLNDVYKGIDLAIAAGAKFVTDDFEADEYNIGDAAVNNYLLTHGYEYISFSTPNLILDEIYQAPEKTVRIWFKKAID